MARRPALLCHDRELSAILFDNLDMVLAQACAHVQLLPSGLCILDHLWAPSRPAPHRKGGLAVRISQESLRDCSMPLLVSPEQLDLVEVLLFCAGANSCAVQLSSVSQLWRSIFWAGYSQGCIWQSRCLSISVASDDYRQAGQCRFFSCQALPGAWPPDAHSTPAAWVC